MNDKKNEKVNPMNYAEIISTDGSLPLPENVGNVKIEKKEMSIREYIALMDKDGKKPIWQRFDNLWRKSARKYLMHSLLNGYPVPPIVLVLRDGKYYCEDGGQRTFSIRAILGDLESAISEHKAIVEDDKASDDAKAAAAAEVKKLEELQGKIKAAKISVWVVTGATEEVERYIYTALNNGVSHSGGDKGASFIPSCAGEFLADTIRICTPIMDAKAARLMSLYFWAAENIPVGKCPAGGKAFPICRTITSAENFVAPTKAPYWLSSFATAAANRPKGKDVMYAPSFWTKAAAVVMVSHGVQCYITLINDKLRIARKAITDYETAKKSGKAGKDLERKAEKAQKASETIPMLQDALSVDAVSAAVKELVQHFDAYDTAAYNIIVGKGTAKNGPVTSKVRACDYMAKSGSGESLSYAKAQLFGFMLEVAHLHLLEKPAEEEKDALLDELNDIAKEEGAAE